MPYKISDIQLENESSKVHKYIPAKCIVVPGNR